MVPEHVSPATVDADRAIVPTRSVPSRSRLGYAIGFVMVLLLDLLALDDITTAGAWMPEILFVLASVPALMTTAYLGLRGPGAGLRSLAAAIGPSSEPERAIGPGRVEGHRKTGEPGQR